MQIEKQLSDPSVRPQNAGQAGDSRVDTTVLNDVVQTIVCDAQHSPSEYVRGANTRQQGE